MKKLLFSSLISIFSLTIIVESYSQEDINNLASDSYRIDVDSTATIYFLNDCIQPILYFHYDKYFGMLKGMQSMEYKCHSGEQLFWIKNEQRIYFFTANLKPGERYFVLVHVEPPKIAAYYSSVAEMLTEDFNTYFDIRPINENEENYNFYKKRLLNKKRVIPTQEKIDRLNKRLDEYIQKNIEKYESDLKFKYKYSHISSEMIISDPEIR